MPEWLPTAAVAESQPIGAVVTMDSPFMGVSLTESQPIAAVVTMDSPFLGVSLTEIQRPLLDLVRIKGDFLPVRRPAPIPVMDVVAVRGQTLLLDWRQAQAFSISCAQLLSRDALIIDIINLPGSYRVSIPLMLIDVQHYGIVGMLPNHPGWVGFSPARKGAQNFYEVSTWSGGFRWLARAVGYIDGAG